MILTSKLPRAVLNFTHHCILRCRWCYVPFQAAPACKNVVSLIIDRIAEIGFKVITIGGGDPFQYDYIHEIVMKAKSRYLIVHIDTNGVLLRESLDNFNMISDAVDLLGLPLDGPTANVHDLVRECCGHFESVMNKLSWLKDKNLNNKVKINTIVTALNSNDLSGIVEIVKKYSPARWSIYQYWAVGPARSVKSVYSISEEHFFECVKSVVESQLGKNIEVEINASDSRRKTYPIIHHDGNVYVHEKFPGDSFVAIGNVFDSDILDKIEASCSDDRPGVVDRYCL